MEAKMMIRKSLLQASAALLVLQCFLFALPQQQQVSAATTDITSTYDWKPLKTGAGGFVTGIDLHTGGNVVYARTDVGGAYRLNDSKTEWLQIVTADSMPDEQPGQMSGVISIASAPGNENIAYMAYRDSVYRSSNKGGTWTKTNVSGISGDANGDGRTTGERLAIDPANDNVVYYGTMGSGLYMTRNGGSNWSVASSVTSSGEAAQGVTSVVLDPSGGTVSTDGVTRTRVAYAAVYNKGIFRTDDGGSNWYKITGSGLGDSGYFVDMEVRGGTLYVVTGGVWKYAGGSWSNISPPTEVFNIAVSPADPSLILAFTGGGAPYRTTNGGSQWTALAKSRTATDVPWLAWTDENWMSVGNVVFDPVVPNKLWFAQGIGVWTTTDIYDSDMTWTSLSAGIEEMVANDVIAPPGGKPVTATWDRPIFYHGNIDAYPAEHEPSPRFNSGWDLDYAYQQPSFVVAAISDHRFCCEGDGQAFASGYSQDGGQSWTAFSSIPGDMRFGNIAVAANDTNNIVYLPSNNKAPYYTTNRGQSWNSIILPGTEGYQDENGNYNGGSHFAYYLNRHVLAADTVNNNTFYLYHNNLGIYRSTNGGQNWSLVNTTLPKGWAVGWFNAQLKSVPGKAGHLFLTFGQLDGESYSLYRSTDGGSTWQEVTDVKDASAIGFGKAASDGGYPAIYLAGKVSGQYGIWRSTDNAANWERIAVYARGLYDQVTAIDGDKDVFGRVYVGYKGNSFVYGEPNGSGSGPGQGSGTGTGLLAHYWNGLNYDQWVMNRTENIDFDWGTGAPSPSMNSDNFQVRWVGYVEPKYTETYTFYTNTDDGVLLYVNGVLLVDKWIDQGPTEWSGTISLQAGQKYSIWVEYYEKTGEATAKLSWSSASQAKEIVPASRLYVTN
jgi:hypothetical protein